LSSAAALSGTPGSPPSKYTDRPPAAAAALSEKIRLAPATRSGSGSLPSRDAHTSGIPSATTTEARAMRARASGSRLAWRQMSTLGVTIQPPRPVRSPSITSATTCSSVSASNSTPATAVI
jgi:hypothetical protein